MAYTEQEKRFFRISDLRKHKSGIVKSYYEKHGTLIPQAELDAAMERIYTLSEADERLVESDLKPKSSTEELGF